MIASVCRKKVALTFFTSSRAAALFSSLLFLSSSNPFASCNFISSSASFASVSSFSSSEHPTDQRISTLEEEESGELQTATQLRVSHCTKSKTKSTNATSNWICGHYLLSLKIPVLTFQSLFIPSFSQTSFPFISPLFLGFFFFFFWGIGNEKAIRAQTGDLKPFLQNSADLQVCPNHWQAYGQPFFLLLSFKKNVSFTVNDNDQSVWQFIYTCPNSPSRFLTAVWVWVILRSSTHTLTSLPLPLHFCLHLRIQRLILLQWIPTCASVYSYAENESLQIQIPILFLLLYLRALRNFPSVHIYGSLWVSTPGFEQRNLRVTPVRPR